MTLFKFRHPIPGSPQKHQCFRLECSPPRRGWHDPVASPIHPSSVGRHGPGERWPSPKRWMMDGSLWILNEMDGEFVINFVKSKSRSKVQVQSISNCYIYIIYCYQLFPSTKDSIDFFFRRAKSVASHLFGDQTHTWSEQPPILDHKEEQFLCNCLSEQNEPWDDCACNPSQIESKAGFGEVQNNLWFFWSQRTKTNRFYIAKGKRQVFQSLTMVPWNLMKIKPTKMIRNAGFLQEHSSRPFPYLRIFSVDSKPKKSTIRCRWHSGKTSSKSGPLEPMNWGPGNFVVDLGEKQPEAAHWVIRNSWL